MLTFIIFTGIGLAIAADWGMFEQGPGETKQDRRVGIFSAIVLALAYGAWIALT